MSSRSNVSVKDPSSGPDSGLRFPVIGIGASAGGIRAILTLLENLPDDCGMALVVVIHLSPQHESNAAEILGSATGMRVRQVQGRVPIEPNTVYVIPPAHDLAMVDGHLQIADAIRPRGRHVVIDRFFRTLAEAHADRSIGIVLSGTGSDGSAGIAWLKQQGGVVMAQSPEDAEHDGMPRSAIATGNVDIVLPAGAMGQRLVELWRNIQDIEILDPDLSGMRANPSLAPDAAEEALRQVMAILRQRTGHEFRHYKRATVLRRIERRLQVNQVRTLPAYRDLLTTRPEETKRLLDDLLIGVTQFFRDRSSFEALERDVLPGLAATLESDDSLRVWVPGCSTGEEAYTLAMLLNEAIQRSKQSRKATIFATDIDERAISVAREGRYLESIVADVAPTRVRSFFSKEGDRWRVDKSLRDVVVFALHNVLRDPPFSRLDLISCRNLLIYLDRVAQRDVLQMFHFALRPGGYLFLGSSETVDSLPELFTPVDKTHRIYRSNPVGRSLRGLDLVTHRSKPIALPTTLLPVPTRAPQLADLHQALLDEYGPLSLLVTGDHQIIHTAGRVGDFLRFAEGAPTRDVLQAARPELRAALRFCLHRALQSHGRADSEPIETWRAGESVVVRISAKVVQSPRWPGELLLVTFNEAEPSALRRPNAADAEGKDPALVELERELERKTEQLQLTVEQYETSAEELKASNEELQAINEELRSASEELETSKEELQSTNEELITVNHELKTKVDETSEINDDLSNLVAGTAIATVFVDPDMRIKRFTPAAAQLFSLIAGDVGRPLFDITHRLDYPEMAEDAREVFGSLGIHEREVRANDGRWYLARLLPYRTSHDRIGGVVLTFVDVTSRREAERSASLGRDQMRLIADTMTDFAIMTIDVEGRVTSWSSGAQRIFGWTPQEVLGHPIDLIFTPEDRVAGAPANEMRLARETGRAPDERWHIRKDGTLLYVSGVMSALPDGATGFAKICRDLTHERTADAMREFQLTTAQQGVATLQADSAMKGEFLAVMSHELKHPLNLINVNAQLLMTLPEAQTIEPVMRAARTIQRTVQGQARIIDDLLDLSRTSTGKLTLNVAPLLLAEALQPCLNWAASECRQKGMRLTIEGLDEPLVIQGDPIRIEQIAWNLLSNAVKFGRAGGSIAIRLRRDRDDALLEVQDSGRGISPEFLPHVFDMFRQAEPPSSRQEGGLGIGLALVKSLVELHHGRVEASSEGAGRGATFRVRLPLHERAGFTALDMAGTATNSLAGTRILLADDEVETLGMFADLLRGDGAHVVAVNSGREALEAAERESFDLIVSDIGMPVMDGYELIAELRARPATATVPAIALTGFGRPQDVTRALAAGFTRHLDKPIDFKLMRSMFDELLRKNAAPAA